MAKEITILGKLDALGRLTVESDESCQAKIDVGGETWIESYTRGSRSPPLRRLVFMLRATEKSAAKEWRSISSDGPETLNDESESEGAKVKL